MSVSSLFSLFYCHTIAGIIIGITSLINSLIIRESIALLLDHGLSSSTLILTLLVLSLRSHSDLTDRVTKSQSHIDSKSIDKRSPDQTLLERRREDFWLGVSFRLRGQVRRELSQGIVRLNHCLLLPDPDCHCYHLVRPSRRGTRHDFSSFPVIAHIVTSIWDGARSSPKSKMQNNQ